MSSCETDFCDKVYMPKLESQYRDLDKLTEMMEREMKSKKKAPKLLTAKTLKAARETCMITHCNPTCKDTIITEAKDTPAMKKQFKAGMNAIPGSKSEKAKVAKIASIVKDMMRKTIKKYKQPLARGFYKGLPAADVAMLKRSGATSGCTTILALHLLNKTKKFGKKMIKMVKRTAKQR